jgi:leucyl-tRNA synthetase
MSQRDFRSTEKKWQDRWSSEKTYAAVNDPASETFYGLIEFPFPSAEGLHVGHPRSYTAIDAVTRKKRMEGKNVLFPIGWDAFGLPTENYAIKNKVRPQDASKKNIANFRRQLQSIGFGFDWDREVDTTDPRYYKWTQWMFQQFFKYGLAYKAASTINWCPRCKIGLANEEAQGGVCERCGNGVEKREKKQWMIRITKYAERLLQDLAHVDYLEKIKAQQTNWIGKSEGAYVDFAVIGSKNGADTVTVFTTRPDTLFGVTYLVLAPEHPLVEAWIKEGDVKNAEAVRAYREASAAKTEMERTTEGKEKTGVALEGVMAVNPANGETVPVWVSDYVLGGYGTGAIMAVPAHDERDFAFAQRMGLPVRSVVRIVRSRPDVEGRTEFVTKRKVVAIVEDGKGNILTIHWPKELGGRLFVGGTIEKGETAAETAVREVIEETGYTDIEVLAVGDETYVYKYFAHAKNQAVEAFSTFVHLRLKSYAEQSPKLEPTEAGNFTVEWLPIAQAKKEVIEPLHVYGFEKFIEGKCFSGEGVAEQSGFLDGLPTERAAKAMVEWLEKEKKGSRATTYKLRDWVFSRQRYWGEPIPLVHCDACAKTKQKALLVHGFVGSPEYPTIKNIRMALEEAGFEVVAPAMAAAADLDTNRWVEELAPHIAALGPQDIIVAHSLGGRMAVHALAEAKKKVKALFLIAPAIGTRTDADWDRYANDRKDVSKELIEKFKQTWKGSVPLHEIDALVERKEVFWSEDDIHVPRPEREMYGSDWYFHIVKGARHFVREEPFEEVNDAVCSARETGWIMDKNLPVTLPEIGAYEPTDSGESPLSKATEWVNVACPRCGSAATRETDTMPNWAGSSWYFLRYTDPQNDATFASPEALKQWMPVDLYNGGMEHTTLHLLYSRFWHKFLWDIGAVPEECGSEPYAKRRSHGLILAEGGEKMSKSKGNVVNPDDVVAQYGADVFRVYEMFMGPFDQPVPWDVNGIEGVKRFLDKVDDLFGRAAPAASVELETLYHQTVKKLSDGIEQMQFNTCVSQLMILANAYQAAGGVPEAHARGFLQMLAPFAPHVTEELWEKIGGVGSVHARGAGWPAYDPSKLTAATFELVLQVNGKVRDRVQVPSDISEEEAKQRALSSEAVQKTLGGASPKQVIYVKGRLVNVVG